MPCLTVHTPLPSHPNELSVEKRGFFDGLKSSSTEYERRFRKVVSMFRQKMNAMIGDRPTVQAVPPSLSRNDSDSSLDGGAVVLKPNPLNGKKKARRGRSSAEIPLETEKENDDSAHDMLSPIPIVHSAKRIRGGRESVLATDDNRLVKIETHFSASRRKYSNSMAKNAQILPHSAQTEERLLPSMPPTTREEEVGSY